jgi:hypothetical protein
LRTDARSPSIWRYGKARSPEEEAREARQSVRDGRRHDQQELERVPDLARFGPEIETVSLMNARGFLEHDTLRRLPKLKRLFIAGSTLARHRSQIDPRIAKAGVEISG